MFHAEARESRRASQLGCRGRSFSWKKLEDVGKNAAQRDPVTKQQTEEVILRHSRHVVAACMSRRGISKHDRSLSGLCIPYVAGAEMARAPASVDRHMSSVVGGAGGSGKNCERCAT
jgi:hypothetical protein